MILFHAKRDGTVTTTPNFVPQGSSMQDLVVVSEFDYAYCAIKLLPASGEYIEDVPCTPILQRDFSTIFTAPLPPKATVVAGSVDYQLIFTAADGTTQTTLVGSFTVPRGVPVSTPGSVEELSVKTIGDIYTIMANTYGLFVGHEGNIYKNTEDIAALNETVNQTDADVDHLEESVIALNKKLDPVLAKYDHLQINSLQIGANVWITSGATSLQYIGTIGSYNDDETTKAFAAILVPMDAETASEAATVGLEVAYTLALGGSIYATLSVKSRPAKDMRFAAVCFTLDNETGEPFKASCAIVGVGSGSGKDGKTPHIGDNGNWWIGEKDTGVSATGAGGIGSIQFKDDGEGNYVIATSGGTTVNLADDGDGNFMLEVI